MSLYGFSCSSVLSGYSDVLFGIDLLVIADSATEVFRWLVKRPNARLWHDSYRIRTRLQANEGECCNIKRSICGNMKFRPRAFQRAAELFISSQLMKPTGQIPMLGLVGKQRMLLAAKGTSGGKERLPCRI
ncbi:hypothetical protein B5F33_09440 [Collinsella sp. An2]|nr:hypothetical protein B5F33_09440 [Collinsella sp. An2]